MDIKQQITNYFRETLAIDLEPSLWQPARRLPIYLRDGYTYYVIDLLDEPCLIMVDVEDDQSAATIKKHIDQVKTKWNSEVIYAKTDSSSDERRRLIEQKIPFVVPGNQMYLPTLGIDLREYFRKKSHQVEKFSPATQAVLLTLLTDDEPRRYTSQGLIERLYYSKMTISRSLNDLKSIGVVNLDGRTRILEFDGDRKSLWERALPYLDSPVKQTIFLKGRPEWLVGCAAGFTALSKCSMLADTGIRTIAMDPEDLQNVVLTDGIKAAKAGDQGAVQVEVWSYDPTILAKGDLVDPFSLYLSLRDEKDERVEEALEQLMGAITW